MPGPTLVLDLSASLYMALVDDSGRTLARRVQEQARGEAAHGLLDEILAEAGLVPDDLGDVAVGIGPGSFTGIRVGVALAQGLAFVRRLPLHPFSSLAAMRTCAAAWLASEGGETGDPGGLTPALVAAIAANAGRWYVSAGAPPAESLMAAGDLIALGGLLPPGAPKAAPSPAGSVLVTYGPVPAADSGPLAAAFPRILRMEDILDPAAVAVMARRSPPVLDGIIRPNYLMASAAEEKRQAAAGAPDPGAGGTTERGPGRTPAAGRGGSVQGGAGPA